MTTDTSELFATFNCERAEYEIKISLDKFESERFKNVFYESIEVPFNEDKNSNRAVGATRHSDYHLHFDWQLSKKKNSFRTRLAYVNGESKPDKGDKGPYADEFMNWLGTFFR